MNTRLVDPRTMWAVLAMEASVALPVMSLPTQGDRLTGLAGPILLLMLLPLGYAAVYQFRELRDPSWRLLTGIGLALSTRLIVSNVPEASPWGLGVWLGRSFAPAAIGVALWWRGGALAVSELTPAEVRTEFGVVALCLLLILSLVRPFLLPDPVLLGCAVALFAVGGLIATALARQEAAEVAAPRLGGALAAASGLLPAGAAVVLVGMLRPELLGTMWFLLARAIELILTPIGLVLAWLSSLFPRAPLGPPPTPPPRPTLPAPDPAALADAQAHMAWIGTVIAVTLMIAIGIAALLAARLLLQNWIGEPRHRSADRREAQLIAETTGAPGEDAADVLGWLLGWLQSRFSSARRRSRASQTATFDAWAAYKHLLAWAERQGVPRRLAETTGQLSTRLSQHVPELSPEVELITRTYEWQRYGAIAPESERLEQVHEALRALSDG